MNAISFRITEVNGQPVIGDGVGFERIRRITGYLVGSIERFNNAKKAEVFDRVRHSEVGGCERFGVELRNRAA